MTSYVPTPTLTLFHNDDSPVRCVSGPVGSGKSSGCVTEIFLRAARQAPNAKGVRPSRWAVIRKDYPALKTTTVKTFTAWAWGYQPANLVMDSPIRYRSNFRLPDNTTVDLEVYFMPLDHETDLDKLLSLELTGAYVNEGSQLIDIVDRLRGRLGRYPSMAQGGVACSWSGLWIDTNPPSRTHWIYTLFEVERPKGFRLFKQPPALLVGAENPETGQPTYLPNPLAENVENLPGGFDYYLSKIDGAKQSYVDTYILGNYGSEATGRPVFTSYNDRVHVAKHPLVPDPTMPLFIGCDFGLNPAAVLCQPTAHGTLQALDEVAPADVLFDEFFNEHLLPVIRTRFPRYQIQVVGDPAGTARNAMSQKGVFDYFKEAGIAAFPAFTNDPMLRMDSADHFLTRQSGFVLDPTHCPLLREAMAGGYVLAPNRGASGKGSTPRFVKGPLSHVGDAFMYVTLYLHRENSNKRSKVTRPGAGQAKKKVAFA